MSGKLKQLVARKVVRVPGLGACWEVVSHKIQSNSYACLSRNHRTIKAHRLSYSQAFDIPAGMCACHKCDNPSCINPMHIFTGTRRENALDRDKKGRCRHGEKHADTKISLDQVKEIRRRHIKGHGGNTYALAVEFNLTGRAIRRICDGSRWRRSYDGLE